MNPTGRPDDSPATGGDVAAIVLAGGASGRMGKPKALLTVGNQTFLEAIIHTLRAASVSRIVVVLGAHANEILAQCSHAAFTVVRNAVWQEGQLSSILCGLDMLEGTGVEATLVHPVDHPLVAPATITGLVSAFRSSKKDIVIPVFKGRRGHPAIFGKRLFRELRSAPQEIGAREVVRQHATDIFEMATDDEGVVIDIDTPEDYRSRIALRAH